MSGNFGEMGFDREPEVYLMGHSSGAHIALLYLIRRAEEEEAKAAAAAATVPAARTSEPVGGRMDSSVSVGGTLGDADGDAGGDRPLDVEGFIGLAGVYDVYQHYLYESWRSAQHIHSDNSRKLQSGRPDDLLWCRLASSTPLPLRALRHSGRLQR